MMTRSLPPGGHTTRAKACTGCGKDLSRGAFDQEFPDGRYYPLCFGRSYRQSSAGCYRKALEKLRICPGCKQADTIDVGHLCRTCHEFIERGREVAMDDSLTFYFVNPSEWVPSTYGTRVWDHNDSDALLAALVDAIATGRTRKNTHAYGEKKEFITRKPEPGVPSSSTHLPGFEGTKKQAEAVKTFLNLFHAQLKTQRMAGRSEGRSLLAGLASGELSTNEWTAQDKELENDP